MAKLWRQCTQQQTHVLDAEMIVAVLGENGPEALVKARLGEVVEGGIRIRGTRGRIEWLAKLRKNARKGGKAKAAKRQTRGNPEGSQEAAKSVPPPCPPAPAPAPAPAPVQDPDLSSEAEQARPGPEIPGQAWQLANQLAEAITLRQPDCRELQPKRRGASIRRWADSMRLAHEQDGRDWSEMERVLAWSQRDSFWAPNIRSGAKFRDKYDDLKARMTEGQPNGAKPARHWSDRSEPLLGSGYTPGAKPPPLGGGA
jgi:hypothetical protein